MTAPTNRDRADWALAACQVFAGHTGQKWFEGDGEASSDEQQEIVGDLLCDLMHLCDFYKVDFCAALASGSHHYDAERTDEYPAALLDRQNVNQVKAQVTALAEVVARDQKAQGGVTENITRRLARIEHIVFPVV